MDPPPNPFPAFPGTFEADTPPRSPGGAVGYCCVSLAPDTVILVKPDAGADAGVWLAQARWLLQQGQERYAGLGQQAATLLGFQGATIAIVAATASAEASRWASWARTAACVVGVVAAWLSARALWPRKTAEVDYAEFESAWATMVNEGHTPHLGDPEAMFAEQLAHGRRDAKGGSTTASTTSRSSTS